MPAARNADPAGHGSKREHGQYFTARSPFDHQAFRNWLGHVPDGTLLEPFAGANNLVAMVDSVNPGKNWQWESFDIDPRAPDVQQREVLDHFPVEVGAVAVVTNPPYLAKNVARRRGYDLAADRCGTWSNLYLRCLDTCLEHVPFVAAIVPDSFVTADTLTERLWDVITIDSPLFDDTDVPVCLALFGDTANDNIRVWNGERPYGTLAQCLTHWSAQPNAVRYATKRSIAFNAPGGAIGLRACDTTTGAHIAFMPGCDVDVPVGPGTRYLTRIDVRDTAGLKVDAVIDIANELLEIKREATGDFGLTSFRGRRADGRYRRRIDYATARNVLAEAVALACDASNPAHRDTLRLAG